MATESKNYLSAAGLALKRAWQGLAEKDQDADSAKPGTDLETPATEPFRQDKPGLPTNYHASDVAAPAEPIPQVPTNEARRRPMKTADEYRDKAAECERLARDGDDDLRALYNVQAAHWRFLAEQADTFEAQAQKRKILDAPSEQ